MRRISLLAAYFLLFSASHAFADFYRWVDKDGNEFYSNDRKQIPAEYQDRATPVRPDESRVSVSTKAPPRTAVVREHRDRNGRGEEYWRRRGANLRQKLRKEQNEYELVLRQIEEQDRKPKPARGGKKKASLEKKKIKLEKRLAAIRRELEVDLPEEARRAEAYPGWIRE